MASRKVLLLTAVGSLLVATATLGGCFTERIVTSASLLDAHDDAPDDASAADVAADNPCTRFLSCVYAVAPDQAAGASAAYGPDGACWKTQDRDACSKGCSTGLVGLHKVHASESACALCSSDEDCSGSTPACDKTHGDCVACTSNVHCGGSTPICDTKQGACVACTSDSQCKAPTSACDLTAHECVECTASTQCGGRRECLPTHRCACTLTNACGTCRTCDQAFSEAFGRAPTPGEASCAGSKCVATSVEFTTRNSCSALCVPWSCATNSNTNAVYQVPGKPETYTPLTVACNEVPAPTIGSVPFQKIFCPCRE